FFDALVIGDGEEVLLEILDLVQGCRGVPRPDLLMQMAQLDGVYVPSLYEVQYASQGRFESIKPLESKAPERVRRRVVKSLDKAYFPEKPVVPYMSVVHDRAVLEVMRGCQRGCRFCHAGMVYRPVRERRLNTLLAQAEAQIRSTGYDEVSLVSLSTLDFSQVKPLVSELVQRYRPEGIGVALPSLRVDQFSVDLANEVQKVRKTTLTLAPEAGTQRLRDVINKNVTEEQLMDAVEAAFSSGWTALKLYFMMGLPRENYEDLDGIIDLLVKVKGRGDELAPRRVEIRASLA
ncbi:MAG TPA: B12-binding domain-containing radical SAM protein, partial [Syntrophomonas sp.]|nr:B12-binding domain-containing radical SAM protein [Syntrophomonas sp.]